MSTKLSGSGISLQPTRNATFNSPQAVSPLAQAVKGTQSLMNTFPPLKTHASLDPKLGTKKAPKATLSLENENLVFDPVPIGKSQVLKVSYLETIIFFFQFKKLNISVIYKAIILIFSVNLLIIFIYKFCKL